MRTERTRMTDRYPLTERLTWRFLSFVDRLRAIKPQSVVWLCIAGVIYGFAFAVVGGWWSGK